MTCEGHVLYFLKGYVIVFTSALLYNLRGPVCHVHLFIRDQITFAYNEGTTKRSLITQYMFYSSTRLWVLVKLGFKIFFFFPSKKHINAKISSEIK